MLTTTKTSPSYRSPSTSTKKSPVPSAISCRTLGNYYLFSHYHFPSLHLPPFPLPPPKAISAYGRKRIRIIVTHATILTHSNRPDVQSQHPGAGNMMQGPGGQPPPQQPYQAPPQGYQPPQGIPPSQEQGGQQYK